MECTNEGCEGKVPSIAIIPICNKCLEERLEANNED